MKRFYKVVTVIPFASLLEGEEDSFSILHDSKPVKTPARAMLALPTRELAEAIADEWREQGEEIEPATMPLTRLANTAVDGVGPRRAEVIEEVLDFARHDHLCYRAEGPAELLRRQSESWDKPLDWAAERYGARLARGNGIAPVAQPEAAIAALRAAIESRATFELAALHAAASICGSQVLALALADGRLSAAEAFALSQLDERYQAEKWGVDAQAEARARLLAAELEAAGRFLRLSRA